jgi:hypothetical protein
VNPNTSTGTKAEIGLTKEGFAVPGPKLQTGTMENVDGAVTGESESTLIL